MVYGSVGDRAEDGEGRLQLGLLFFFLGFAWLHMRDIYHSSLCGCEGCRYVRLLGASWRGRCDCCSGSGGVAGYVSRTQSQQN